MKEIAKQYGKNGFKFTQVWREGDIAIYRQEDSATFDFVAYEVFEVMKNKERVIMGNVLPPFESCPSNELWGQKGFTVRTLADARDKAEYLAQKILDRRQAATLKQKLAS